MSALTDKLNGGTAIVTTLNGPEPETEPVMVQTKVHRVRIRPDELIDCGFYPEMIDGWGFLKRYLMAKGLPEWCCEDRTPCRMDVEADGCVLLEFEG